MAPGGHHRLRDHLADADRLHRDVHALARGPLQHRFLQIVRARVHRALDPARTRLLQSVVGQIDRHHLGAGHAEELRGEVADQPHADHQNRVAGLHAGGAQRRNAHPGHASEHQMTARSVVRYGQRHSCGVRLDQRRVPGEGEHAVSRAAHLHGRSHLQDPAQVAVAGAAGIRAPVAERHLPHQAGEAGPLGAGADDGVLGLHQRLVRLQGGVHVELLQLDAAGLDDDQMSALHTLSALVGIACHRAVLSPACLRVRRAMAARRYAAAGAAE